MRPTPLTPLSYFACLLMASLVWSSALSAPSAPASLWFSLRVDGSPPRYTNQLSALSPWVRREGRGCVTALRSGDALTITQRPAPQSCHVSRGRLSARALLAFGVPLDLNQASKEDLTLLRGVGPQLARRIVDGRPWRAPSSLLRLRGIGAKLLERISPKLSVEAPPLIHLGGDDDIR